MTKSFKEFSLRYQDIYFPHSFTLTGEYVCLKKTLLTAATTSSTGQACCERGELIQHLTFH